MANAAMVLDDIGASATVIQHTFSDLGMPLALGDKQGFINLPTSLLMRTSSKYCLRTGSSWKSWKA